MGKTTNILDLNNRLEKVEKENVPQNNYNSLKNRPKINGNLLTGDKTGAQLGLADIQDIGDISELETTATNLVGAINEVNGGVIASVTADGVKTYSALFNELYALLSNATILYPNSLKLTLFGGTFQVSSNNQFYRTYTQNDGTISTLAIMLNASGSTYRQISVNTSGTSSYISLDSNVVSNGTVISVIY